VPRPRSDRAATTLAETPPQAVGSEPRPDDAEELADPDVPENRDPCGLVLRGTTPTLDGSGEDGGGEDPPPEVALPEEPVPFPPPVPWPPEEFPPVPFPPDPFPPVPPVELLAGATGITTRAAPYPSIVTRGALELWRLTVSPELSSTS